MRIPAIVVIAGVVLALSSDAQAFVFSRNVVRRPTTARYNFLKNMIDEAFGNDQNLSQDRTKQQYDAPGEEFQEITTQKEELTETQKKWKTLSTGSTQVTASALTGSALLVDLYLAGVASRDPSNDLYASKVNISSRDRATGLSIPDQASASSIRLDFLEDGVCRASASEFTTGEKTGQWKLSEDGKVLRFSMDVMGYTRTVQTKGSIQKVYWSEQDEVSTSTTSTYEIPPGWVYGDVPVMTGKRPGSVEFDSMGVLQVEKKMGLLGAASKMVPCGKFAIRVLSDE